MRYRNIQKNWYIHIHQILMFIECFSYQVQLLTAVSQVRVFKLATSCSCGCTWDLIFTQTCYTSEILTSNCTMTLALSLLVQSNTLQLYLPFGFMEATVPLIANFLPSQFNRHLLALIIISLSLDLMSTLGFKNFHAVVQTSVFQPQHY